MPVTLAHLHRSSLLCLDPRVLITCSWQDRQWFRRDASLLTLLVRYCFAAELQMLGLLRPASHRRGDQAQKLVFPYVANGS